MQTQVQVKVQKASVLPPAYNGRQKSIVGKIAKEILAMSREESRTYVFSNKYPAKYIERLTAELGDRAAEFDIIRTAPDSIFVQRKDAILPTPENVQQLTQAVSA